ncbi:hypothetical protein [Natronomonas sp.]|uniref:hypothetical protein n=1 Tax=Natronomonas sp. TaxID=2184060 RepID=UPI00262B7C37|nr:hypothetical protein [Natronomonas sp.]
MYDRYFEDEEAGEYSTRETLDRAYALGVASVCGDPDDDAFERLKRRSPDVYDESIVELAYEEGRAEALKLEAEGGDDDEEIWERLVEGALEDTSEGSEPPEGLPAALSGPDDGPEEGPPDRLDLPSFLRR